MTATGWPTQKTDGDIWISTESCYLDSPMKGYQTVPEGAYALLKIQDRGIGISTEDLQHIFEPFYTKKVMGRSGTGLGMAVVWARSRTIGALFRWPAKKAGEVRLPSISL